MKNESKNILLLIYSDPYHFPPTINAANILTEQGWNVYLAGFENTDNWSQQVNNEVKGINFGLPKTGVQGVIAYFKSIFFLRKFIRKNHIKWIVGYDAKSVLPCFLATRYTKCKWLFHQHDFWEFTHGPWEKFLWQTERRLLKYADDVSFPQEQRAIFFKQAAHLKKDPLIVFNGPRKKWLLQKTAPNEIILHFRNKFKYLLIYQGGWSTYFALERLFDALSLCRSSVGLILLGEEREPGIRQHYINYLKTAGISDKVYIAEKYIPYEALTGFTKYADAAIGKLTGEEDNAPFNDKYLIGAANKITEYVACGLPVILQDSATNALFFKKYPIGILTDTTDKFRFATDIDELLEDPVTMQHFKTANSQLFIEELNFDDQFQKIVNRIDAK